MAEVAVTSEGSPPPPHRLRSDWKWRLLNELFAAFVALLFLAAGALVLLDTAPGHRFIIDRIGRLETASGLKIRIGRIDGSIFGKSQLKNVAVSDQRGVSGEEDRLAGVEQIHIGVAPPAVVAVAIAAVRRAGNMDGHVADVSRFAGCQVCRV